MRNIKYIIGLIFILVEVSVWGQQDPMFTQYITNPVSINPAITGCNEITTLSLVYREQWVGVDGAPSTMLITFEGVPRFRKMGLGGSFIYDKIGPVIQTGIYMNYAYRVQLDENKKLSFGLMGGVNFYQFDLVSLIYEGSDDDIPVNGLYSKFLPNFGFGAFYYTPKFFAGFSIPKLMRNQLFDTSSSHKYENREEIHVFSWIGTIISLNDNINFKPSLVGRVVNGSPLSLDVNATFELYDKVWLGVLYRLGVTWGGLARFQVKDNLNIGYSYDLFSSRTGGFGAGSHEIFISYTFKKPDNRILSPRYF